jgi:hypothetical protein
MKVPRAASDKVSPSSGNVLQNYGHKYLSSLKRKEKKNGSGKI